MRIPRFWTHAEVDGYRTLGWSDVSAEDARRVGMERARKIMSLLTSGQSPGDEYPYPNRPVREQVIERDDAAGWAITRNCYGSLVLNAANAMFVDIDLPSSGNVGALIGRLFGKKKSDPAQMIIENTRRIVEGMSGMSARLYRTAAGLRLLITSEAYDPTGDLTHDLLRTFGSDQRYATLCKVQECFRARLTPKPWRCDTPRPPVRFPFDSDAQAQRLAAWVGKYEKACRGFSVCQCIETFGDGAIAPAVDPIVKLHDQYACCNTGSPLA